MGDRAIARRVGGTLYYLHYDQLGSLTLVTDGSGAEVGSASYDPYGHILANTIPVTLADRLYTGQRWDDFLGLYDCNGRYYDPLVGRFTQPDPVVQFPYSPNGWNRYAYAQAANNPTTFTDPSGYVIDTVFDVFDLGIDAAGCLAGDDWACLAVPLDIVATAVPFVFAAGLVRGRECHRFTIGFRLSKPWPWPNVLSFTTRPSRPVG